MTQMTFAQFRATRVECDDLGIALGDATLAERGAAGFLYLSKPPNAQGHTGGLYIASASTGNRSTTGGISKP